MLLWTIVLSETHLIIGLFSLVFAGIFIICGDFVITKLLNYLSDVTESDKIKYYVFLTKGIKNIWEYSNKPS